MSKTKKQKKDTEEISEELQAAHLREQIKTLKKLPKNFRDLEVMSSGWQSFAEIMGPEKKAEMLQWAKGGVLCLVPPNELERKVLSVFGTVSFFALEPLLEDMLQRTVECNVSFIYASEWKKVAIAGLNWLASHYEWNFRFKGQLMNGRGMPLGI